MRTPRILTKRGADTARYVTRPVRPFVQAATRTALWGAVFLGAFGGGIALLRPTHSSDRGPAAADPAGDETVPAPVAGVAERAVHAWLTATEGDEDLLQSLFVEPPPARDDDAPPADVVELTTVAGRSLYEGFWTVTIAAEVAETSVDPAVGGAESDGLTSHEVRSTWFVEVGVVGSVDAGLAALSTPAIVPAPSSVSEEWRLLSGEEASAEDPVVVTIDGFLRALLTGEGDVTRYVATDMLAPAVTPAPFTEVVIDRVTVAEISPTEVLARTHAQGMTQRGFGVSLGYELAVEQRSGRWEVAGYSGAPALAGTPGAVASATKGSGE